MNIIKKLLYIIPLLAIFSCTERWEDNHANDGKMTTAISVVLPQIPAACPQQTRAMSLTPDIKNLYVAVFDDNGYLLEYVKADQSSTMATANETLYNYKVSLTPTNFKTIVHFIGNGPEKLSFGTEVEAIGGLITENGADAYWQRVELANGINNNVDSDGKSNVAALNEVRLIRNFAWIKLSEDTDNFIIDSYCVVNTRTKGSVAPYNASRLGFAVFSDQKTHESLVGEGYNGFIPVGAELDKTIPDELTWFKTNGVAADNYAYFVYERESPIKDPAYILVKGYYNGSATPSYYKVDLRDNNGNYFPIIRNFRYGVTITSVKHSGHASAAAAAAGAGSGDVSTSIETEKYTNISNNVARIFVEYTEKILVEQTDDLKLRYKFVVFETKDANGNVVQEEAVLNGTENVTIETDDQGTVINSMSRATDDDTDDWREITIKTFEAGSSRKSQDIIIKGEVTIGTGDNAKTYELQRKVTITLLPSKYTMQLVCDPNSIQEKLGEPFDLIIKMPGGLGSAMFPLEFQLEAANQSMTPDQGDDLPVVTGNSIISTNKTTIGFIKHLEWDDYDALPNENGFKSVVCQFKSNKAVSATDIYAQNKYFNLASTTLENYTPAKFSGLSFNPETPWLMAESEVEFSFSMEKLPSQGYVTVALGNLEPADEEDRLEYIGVVNGKACYSFNPESLSNTLKLKVLETYQTIDVGLSAYHFEDNSASLNPRRGTFSGLKLEPNGDPTLAAGSEVTFSFTMSDMPSGDVKVTLGNLEPTGATRATFENGVYTFKPESTNVELTFKVINGGQTVSAALSANDFEAVDPVSLKPQRGKFENLTFNPNSKITNIGTNVNFTFNMTYLPSEITVALTGLKPATNETRLTKIRENGDVVYYSFTPETTTINNTNALKLEGTASGIAKVELSADNFDPADNTINITYTISSGKIKVNKPGSGKLSINYKIYADANASAPIGNFTIEWKNSETGLKTNSYAFSLSITSTDYETITDNNNNIYIKYTYGGRTYTATADLKTLLKGETVTLTTWTN